MNSIPESKTHVPVKEYKKFKRRSWPRHHKYSILKAVSYSSIPIKEACAVAGIREDQYREWIQQLVRGELRGTWDLRLQKLKGG